MKAFGENSLSYNHGYDLSLITSHLESLILEESNNPRLSKKREQLIELAEEAQERLQKIVEYTGEE